MEDLQNVLQDAQRLLKSLQPGRYELTEAGNGELLADALAGFYVFVPEVDAWFYYDKGLWRQDVENRLMLHCVEVLRRIRQRASEIEDTEKSVKLFNWYSGSENLRKLKSSMAFMSTVPFMVVRISQFDRGDMLLNVKNGTIDLRTGELREHKREDYLSKICNVNYVPDSKSDLFENILDEITEGNREKKIYLQKLSGYCCTGKILEQQFYQWMGPGCNGKTILAETIKYVLGTYAVTGSPDILMAKDMTAIPNDIARLQGARLVLMSEPDPGKRFSDNAIKSLTGGDTVIARFLHKEFFEFSMKAKMIMLTNHEIRAVGTDHGLWRRIIVVPFTYRVPDNKKDKKLQEKLIAEAEAVLAWMVKGCLLWQKEGLQPPQEIVQAKEDYRRGQDAIGMFLDECCMEDSKSKIVASELYNTYKAWCRNTGEYDISQREFGKRLREKGFASVKSGVYYWFGIRLLDKLDLLDQKPVNYNILPSYRNLPKSSPESPVSPNNEKPWWEDAQERTGDL